MTLPAHQRSRLVRLLGLLSSDHDGERANAGAMADRLLRESGLRWDDVIAGHALPPPPPEAWESAAVQILRSGRATDWERGFCHNLLSRWSGRDISEKQADVLGRIYGQRCELQRA